MFIYFVYSLSIDTRVLTEASLVDDRCNSAIRNHPTGDDDVYACVSVLLTLSYD
jgi:hypothetical protein